MQITVNGENIEVEAPTLAIYLDTCGMSNQRIAVELNGEIVVKSKFNTTLLSSGDVIEIVHAIGGG